MTISFIGNLFLNIENKICHNFKCFIGNHEKTTQIMFLSIYVSLQMILAFYIKSRVVTILIITFLFFLALERIFVHIWLDMERRKLKKKEDSLKRILQDLRILNYKELTKLRTENDNLRNLKKKR